MRKYMLIYLMSVTAEQNYYFGRNGFKKDYWRKQTDNLTIWNVLFTIWNLPKLKNRY